MKFRKDIQILRGIAVLLVVLFHLEIAGFSSGFLGVDVFFVISGYLMAIIYDPARTASFFSKRARRLLPAYFVTVIATLLVCVSLTTPNDYGQVATQALFATVFASNIGFWLENSYFNKESFKPLLHLWSLGVEIQFYVFVPLLHVIFSRVRGSFFVILAGSAVLSAIIVGISPKTAFFWLPCRLWEFLLGYGVARYGLDDRLRNALPWLGAAALAVILCIPAIPLEGALPGFTRGHPGLAALVICLATAVTLAAGLPSVVANNPVADLLKKLGDFSYSVYLAHFPVIVLFLYRPFSGTVLTTSSFGQTAVLVLLVAGASAVLFNFVEQPFRAAPHIWRGVFAAAMVTLVVSEGGAMIQTALIPEKEMLIAQAWYDRDAYRCGKLNRILHPMAISCEITRPNSAPAHRVLLVGDSHADAIKSAFAAAAERAHVAVYFMVENNPLLAGGMTAERLVEEARARRAETIVLHYSAPRIDRHAIEKLVGLAKANDLGVAFIMPVPAWDRHVPKMLWQNAKGEGRLSTQSLADYLKTNRELLDWLSTIDDRRFKVYAVADALCHSACLLVSEAGRPLYFDTAHLTRTGSRMLMPVFDRLMAELP
ncbi:MAG: acyltransferase family protein [Xanthobacteraceae bacterium]